MVSNGYSTSCYLFKFVKKELKSDLMEEENVQASNKKKHLNKILASIKKLDINTVVMLLTAISVIIGIITIVQNQNNLKIQDMKTELTKLKALKSELNQTAMMIAARPECKEGRMVIDVFLTDSLSGRLFLGDINDDNINQGIVLTLGIINQVKELQLNQEKYGQGSSLCDWINYDFKILRSTLNKTTDDVNSRIDFLETKLHISE